MNSALTDSGQFAEVLAAKVTDRITYVDTIQIWSKRCLTISELNLLSSHCGKVGPRRLEQKYWPYVRRYLIQRPSKDALLLLETLLAPEDYLINRVEIALDFCVKSQGTANRLRDFFRHHLVQPWPGKRKCKYGGSVWYFGPAWTTRNFAIYPDRISKVTGQICCHLERRFACANGCRRAGFSSVKNILELDYLSFWDKHLILRRYDSDRWEKAVLQERRKYLGEMSPAAHRKALKTGAIPLLKRRIAAIMSNPFLHHTTDPDQITDVPAQVFKERDAKLAARILAPIPSAAFLQHIRMPAP